MTPRRAALAACATGVAVIALDQATKAIVREEIARGDALELILGFDLVHVRNTGVAFGLLADGGALLLVGTALALLALIVFFVLHSGRPLVWLPTGLLLGGAIGNLIDRAHQGHVTDFLKFPHFPAFNVADIAITFGVVALVLVLEGPGRREPARG
ncbi:MAG TPA: signal peptidase II [Solirubrobacteraceae bacterium]|nr:signal peptidase II [Solirubrobacteraceae bacterium]